MAVVLSPCYKSFILALSAPLRAQFRQLLYLCQGMVKAEITKQLAMIGRNDITAAYYKIAADQINNFLRPIEAAMNVIPFSELQGCTEGTILQGNLLLIYYQKKSFAQDLTYRVAQNGFASTYATQISNNLQKSLEKITSVLEALDDLSSQILTIGNHVRVYSTNQTGVISGISGNDVTVTLDSPLTGSVTRPAGDMGRIA